MEGGNPQHQTEDSADAPLPGRPRLAQAYAQPREKNNTGWKKVATGGVVGTGGFRSQKDEYQIGHGYDIQKELWQVFLPITLLQLSHPEGEYDLRGNQPHSVLRRQGEALPVLHVVKVVHTLRRTAPWIGIEIRRHTTKQHIPVVGH